MMNNIRIVLVNTSHPGNIGAVARAMKNMSVERLYLVSPQCFPSAEATARASGADDVLANAVICDTLDEALADCHFVVGTSDRNRSLSWPALEPRECADRLRLETQQGEVAIVFGREHSGMSNEELERCHYLMQIPCNPLFSSLNLAAAVQVVCYELWMTARQSVPVVEGEEDGRELVNQGEMESYYAHLERTLIDLNFLDPQHPKLLMRRMRRLFGRARPDRQEMNILRGMLSAVEGKKLYKRGS